MNLDGEFKFRIQNSQKSPHAEQIVRTPVCFHCFSFKHYQKEQSEWLGNSYFLIFHDISLLMETTWLQQDDNGGCFRPMDVWCHHLSVLQTEVI